jgi:hypothetical protein
VAGAEHHQKYAEQQEGRGAERQQWMATTC